MKPISKLNKCATGLFIIASAIVACKKDSTQVTATSNNQNNQAFGNISYFATTSTTAVKTNASIKILDTKTVVDSSVVVNWAAASVYVTKIEFIGQAGKTVDTTITIGKNLNIFNASALAGVIQLPVGSYKNVSVKMFCEKSLKSELAFNLRGTFQNTTGGTDSVLVASSLPFTANLTVNDITVDQSDKYVATFKFDLTKVLTGIKTPLLQTARSTVGTDNKRTYVIWKGGSAEEPFFNQVIANWQTLASVVITKQ